MQQGPLIFGEALVAGEQVGVSASFEVVGGYANLLEQSGQDQLAADYADGPGDRSGLGKDLVAGDGYVVSAAGGDITHRDDDGFFLSAAAEGIEYDVAGQGRTAGRVDADHHGLD